MSALLDFLQTHEEAFPSLYSDFRPQRSSNPDGYAANTAAWRRALANAARARLLPSAQGEAQPDRFVLRTGDDLPRALQSPELGRPLALGAVVDDAARKREIVPVKAWREMKGKFAWQKKGEGAGGGLVWALVGWGLKQVGLGGEAETGREDRLVREEYVIVGNVEAAAQAVLEQASKMALSNTSRIFSRDLFVSTFRPSLGPDPLSPTDLSVLLVHLSRDHDAISYSATSQTIKFRTPSEPPSLITPEDDSIASLRTLIASLEPQIQHLVDRVAELDQKARAAVAEKQQTAAKGALRSKKLADTKLQQRTATLTQLEEVYAKIEQASDQVEMVRVMEASSRTLKSLNSQTGGVEKVQDVVDGLREQMLDVDEIGHALNDVSAASVDEAEVDDELEQLEKVEREKAEEETRQRREQREEEQAETTRKKLAELDQMGEKEKTEEKHSRVDADTKRVNDQKAGEEEEAATGATL